jgi:di/tricarboxylate transporter
MAAGATQAHEHEVQPPRSGGLYGTVLVLAVIIALTKSGKAEASIVLGGVAVTTLVFFVVHVYADTLASRVIDPQRPLRQIIEHHAHHELPILGAAIAPALPLLLGVAGVLTRQQASSTAIAFGLLGLFGWGVAVGRALGHQGLAAILFGLLNIALGGAMVGLKVLVH